MKSRRILLTTLALALAGCGVAGAPGLPGGATDGVSLFGRKAKPETRAEVVLKFNGREQLEALARAGVDLFHNVDTAKGTVGATLTPRTEAAVKKLGVKYNVVQAAGLFKAPLPKGYQTVEGLEADLKALANKYPAVVHLESIGKSTEGRNIWAVNLTSKPGAKLPAVRLTSGVHARELPPVEVMTRYIHMMAEGYGSDAQITKLLDTRDIWVIPMWNPDGRTKVEKGDSMWRKNTRKNRFGGDGVDINRNADDHWEHGNGSSFADDYKGPNPFSEPETQAVRDLSARVKFNVSLDLHCYAGMVLWPPGFSKDYSNDEAAFKTIGEKMAKPIGYKAGTIARTIYATFGDFATWEYYANGTLSFAGELAVKGFAPPYEQAERSWTEWKPNLLYLADVAGDPKGKSSAMANLPRFGF